MSIRIGQLLLAVILTAGVALGFPTEAGAQDCGDRCSGGERGGASSGPTGLNARVGAGGQPTFTSSGGSSNCVFFRPDAQTNVVITGVGASEFGVFQAQDGVVVAWVGWVCSDFDDVDSCVSLGLEGPQLPGAREARTADLDCDGDGIADTETGDALVEIGDPNELAAFAFDAVPWPELEILTYPDTEVSIISGFEIPLLLDDGAGTTFETEFEADAEDNGLIVTATATARVVNWDQSPINAQFGYDEQFFECETFGEAFMPSSLAANPCVARWRGSSSGQVDNEGNQHRISLVAIVLYDVEYETNLAGVEVLFGEPEFELEIERNNVPVSEIQVLHVAR